MDDQSRSLGLPAIVIAVVTHEHSWGSRHPFTTCSCYRLVTAMVWPWGHRRRTHEPQPMPSLQAPPAHEIASAEHDLQVSMCCWESLQVKYTKGLPRQHWLQVALALSRSANEATVTRSRSEEDQLALAKRESLAMVSHSSKGEALSYQYWESNW